MGRPVNQSSSETLAARIRASGARATPARIQVLHALSAAKHALSRGEIETRLGSAMPDRVTLYRILDWLVDVGLAHRLTNDAGVARYSVAEETPGRHIEHAHFRCDHCGRVYCLDVESPTRLRVPRGFQATRVDLSVHGQCVNCVGARGLSANK